MPFSKTFDAYVPSDGKEFFKLAKFKPDYVPLTELQAVPLDAAHHASFALAEKITPPATFAHCSRVYFFGLAMLYNDILRIRPPTLCNQYTIWQQF
jgi:hypothetical protein